MGNMTIIETINGKPICRSPKNYMEYKSIRDRIRARLEYEIMVLTDPILSKNFALTADESLQKS